MIVSKPIKVTVEIEDIKTGCSYVYKGKSLDDCIKYFQSLFFNYHEFKILYCIKEPEFSIKSKHNYSEFSFIEKSKLIRNLDFYSFVLKGFDGEEITSYYIKEELKEIVNKINEIL